MGVLGEVFEGTKIARGVLAAVISKKLEERGALYWGEVGALTAIPRGIKLAREEDEKGTIDLADESDIFDEEGVDESGHGVQSRPGIVPEASFLRIAKSGAWVLIA